MIWLIENTLDKVYELITDYVTRDGRRIYNIFKVLEMTNKEVLMCRVLTDFLNPNGAHGKGAKYLELFLDKILHREDYEAICATAHVFKEYPIEEERRIDIVIESKQVFIPIEVKIHAGEQRAQCYDYYMYAKRKDNNPQVVYLTKQGSMPSDYSLCSANGQMTLRKNDICCISFAEDICYLMQLIIDGEEDAIIREMAKQYRDAIKEFTLFVDEELQMEVANKMCENEKYFRSMLTIEQSAKKAKAKLISLLFEELECQMKELIQKYHLERETRFRWYEYKEKATEAYYAQNESTYPGLNYVCTNVCLSEGIQLWLRIEVDNNLFAGICLFDTKSNKELGMGEKLDRPSQFIKDELGEYLNLVDAQYENWWVKYWYLPTGHDNAKVDRDRVPNFKDMNEAAVSLSDKETRTQFVSECIDAIDIELKKIFL